MRASAVVAAVLLLAGCSADAPAARVGGPTLTGTFEGGGRVEILVTDDQAQPLPGSDVAVVAPGLSLQTDVQGRAVFEAVPPGEHVVAVQRLGYESQARKVVVEEGETVTAAFALVALAVEDAPYHLTQEKPGRMGCGFAVRPVYSDSVVCFYLNTTTNGAVGGHGVSIVALQSERHKEIQGLVLETTWKYTQYFGGAFMVLWWNGYGMNANGAPSGNDWRLYTQAEGKSPVRIVLPGDEFQEITYKQPYPKQCLPDAKRCHIIGDVRTAASTLGTPVDFGAYWDQKYAHWITEFMGAPPTDDFSALPDG